MFIDQRHPDLPTLPCNENASASSGIAGREKVERKLLQMNMQP